MKKEYTSESIRVLEGLDPVRKRPSMYIGNTSSQGLHHLVYELMDNSVDEAMVGFCDEISVIIHIDNSVTVIDNGRGIPVDDYKDLGISAAEVVMTKLHAGGKFDNKAYVVSGGLHGVGISVVSALSKFMKVEVMKDGKVWWKCINCGYVYESETALENCPACLHPQSYMQLREENY